MTDKKQLGQFYTTNMEYILQGLIIPDNIKIIEPFTGNGDLIKNIDSKIVESFDIDPKLTLTIKNDSLLNPPVYKNKFVLTNPPYLARNKSSNKTIYDFYNLNDLYKCFIQTLLNDPPTGGILIIPINFFSSNRVTDLKLRKRFLNTFEIKRLNIFENKVFNDTSCATCSFSFILKNNTINNFTINTFVFPLNNNIQLKFTNYIIGGEIYEKVDTIYKCNRLIGDDISNTFINVYCLDNIRMVIDKENRFIDNTVNKSNRTFLSLQVYPEIDIEKQVKLVNDFNTFIKIKRCEYNSLFLTNYREGNRKRISFDLVYSITQLLLNKTI